MTPSETVFQHNTARQKQAPMMQLCGAGRTFPKPSTFLPFVIVMVSALFLHSLFYLILYLLLSSESLLLNHQNYFQAFLF